MKTKILLLALTFAGMTLQGSAQTNKRTITRTTKIQHPARKKTPVARQSRPAQPEMTVRLKYDWHFFVYRTNGLWGLTHDDKGTVTPPIYKAYEERDGYVIFTRQDGKYDFYRFSDKIFEMPADRYTIETVGTEEYLVAYSGSDVMVFEPWRGHSLAPLTAYKRVERMLLCRYKDGSFAFCSIDGLDYIDNLKHPRRLICRSSGEDLVVCEMPDGNQKVLKRDGWGYSTFTPEKWRIIERDYLRKSNIEDPVFEEVYEHEPSINTIFYRLR